MDQAKRETTRGDYQERMLRVLVHIQTHLDEALCLDDLAGVANFSPFHFHRIFRGMVGESVSQHVRRLRLERAAHRLKFTDHPVTRIAFEAGFEAHEAFTRAFGSMFDVSPSEFRKRQHALPMKPIASGVHYSPGGRLTEFKSTGGGGEAMDVRVERLEPTPVAFVRHTGPYNEVGGSWNTLFAWAGPNGLAGPNAAVFGVVHDDPSVTPPERLRYDACLAVAEGVQPAGDIGVQTVGGGEYAVVRHVGPYDGLSDLYARLCGIWLPDSGRELRSAPALEFYRNSPFGTPPEELITDVFMPLENLT